MSLVITTVDESSSYFLNSVLDLVSFCNVFPSCNEMTFSDSNAMFQLSCYIFFLLAVMTKLMQLIKQVLCVVEGTCYWNFAL
jgi:hypothetical protein